MPRSLDSARRLATLLLLALPAAPAVAHPQATASCEEAKRTNAWCTSEKVGYIASVAIHSTFLYEVLDPHGHPILKSEVTCPTCLEAIETDGYCPAHKMGYVRGQAWMSSITWHLARAKPIDPKSITCQVCRRHVDGIGWCEKDKVGIAGYFAVTDRKEFESLTAAYQILLQANAMAEKCETCAGAMITDETCPLHHIKYSGGKAVSGSPP